MFTAYVSAQRLVGNLCQTELVDSTKHKMSCVRDADAQRRRLMRVRLQQLRQITLKHLARPAPVDKKCPSATVTKRQIATISNVRRSAAVLSSGTEAVDRHICRLVPRRRPS